MTDKQATFVREYLVDMNATLAVKRTGYSQRTAYSKGQRLLKNDEVRAAISAAMSERKDELSATRAQRKAFWTAVMLDTDVGMKDRLKASELLGKSKGDFTEKREVTHDMSGVYDLSRLNEQELLQLRETLAWCKR